MVISRPCPRCVLVHLYHCYNFIKFLLHQVTNTLPYAILFDYSCIDNMQGNSLLNSYHRTCINYAQLAAYIHDMNLATYSTNNKIQHIMQRGQDIFLDSTMVGFMTLLKVRNCVPHLVRLLRAGGIWTVNCENAYAALVKCCVDPVCLLQILSLYTPLIVSKRLWHM